MNRSIPLSRSIPLKRTTWLRNRRRAARLPAELEAHHAAVRALGCIVSGDRVHVTLHHPHSGSMTPIIGLKGGGRKTSDWLVIPLSIYLHSMGPQAIDGAKGVLSWEADYGTQVSLVDEVCRQLGVNVWRKAGIKRKVVGLVERPQQ